MAQGSDVEPGTAPVIGPLVATAAGRLGNSDYVIGEAGPKPSGGTAPMGRPGKPRNRWTPVLSSAPSGLLPRAGPGTARSWSAR